MLSAKIILSNLSTIQVALGRQLADKGQMLGAALCVTVARSDEAIGKLCEANDETAIVKAILEDQSCILAGLSLMAPAVGDQKLLALMGRATSGIAKDMTDTAEHATTESADETETPEAA